MLNHLLLISIVLKLGRPRAFLPTPQQLCHHYFFQCAANYCFSFNRVNTYKIAVVSFPLDDTPYVAKCIHAINSYYGRIH